MDEIEKLLRKAKRKDRERLLEVMQDLQKGKLDGMHIKKLVGSSVYRIRVGNFRILFSIDSNTKQAIVESVRLRNEKTYRL